MPANKRDKFVTANDCQISTQISDVFRRGRSVIPILKWLHTLLNKLTLETTVKCRYIVQTVTTWWQQSEVLLERAQLMYFNWHQKSLKHFVLCHIHITKETPFLNLAQSNSLQYTWVGTPLSNCRYLVYRHSFHSIRWNLHFSSCLPATLSGHLWFPLQRPPNSTHVYHCANNSKYSSLWTDWESDGVEQVFVMPWVYI